MMGLRIGGGGCRGPGAGRPISTFARGSCSTRQSIIRPAARVRLPTLLPHRSLLHTSRTIQNENRANTGESAAQDTAKAISPTASANPPLSIAKRLTSLFALKEASGDTGSSSIGKLIELAKPEKKQLGIGIGLVRLMSEYLTSCLARELVTDDTAARV